MGRKQKPKLETGAEGSYIFYRAHGTEMKNFASHPGSRTSMRYLMTAVEWVPPVCIIVKEESAFGNGHSPQKLAIYFILFSFFFNF